MTKPRPIGLLSTNTHSVLSSPQRQLLVYLSPCKNYRSRSLCRRRSALSFNWVFCEALSHSAALSSASLLPSRKFLSEPRMVWPYAIKGRKRKKENYDKEEIEQHIKEEEATKKVRTASVTLDEEKAEEVVHELGGIPIVPSDQNNKARVIFILEKASLEVAKVGKSYQLLNSDDHANFLRRNNRNPADYRPDIAHQAILAILDSPLNKSGRLQALYVRTEKGVLFEVKPHVRIPRTYKRFSGIMLQLLQKLSITAVGKREKLLRVIKNPVTQYLPINSRKIGFSYSSDKLVDMRDYVAAVNNDVNLVFVVGAMAHGKIDKEYVDDFIAVSGYPLSAACCISRICGALEEKWKIL